MIEPAITCPVANAPSDRKGRVTLRTVEEADESFLFSVYASTREEELARVAWDEPARQRFLGMQFKAQSHSYRTGYPGAIFQVILVDDRPAGRLYVHRRANELRVMDIALLPEYRGRGIGTALLKDMMEGGRRAGLPVTIHVEMFNPALRLYERLGFKKVASNSVYHLLEYAGAPDALSESSATEPGPAPALTP
jgi:ribosomal protein S18 acetylase RimI-like enzyme